MRKPFRDDLSGRTFGHLTAIEYRGKTDDLKQSVWLFRCSCGVEIEKPSYPVKCGNTKSCGCATSAMKSAIHTTHGLSNTSEYNSYRAMVRRCSDPSGGMYHRYGGRGISVCERWLGPEGLANFLDDMGEKPTEKHTIERIDGDGNYEPGNCIWSTRREQADNRMTTRHVTVGEITLSQSGWDAARGDSVNIVGDRIRRGWTEESAVSVPTATYRRELTHDGLTLSMNEWENRMKLGHGAIAYRLKAGWSVVDAITKPSKKKVPLKRFASITSA